MIAVLSTQIAAAETTITKMEKEKCKAERVSEYKNQGDMGLFFYFDILKWRVSTNRKNKVTRKSCWQNEKCKRYRKPEIGKSKRTCARKCNGETEVATIMETVLFCCVITEKNSKRIWHIWIKQGVHRAISCWIVSLASDRVPCQVFRNLFFVNLIIFWKEHAEYYPFDLG